MRKNNLVIFDMAANAHKYAIPENQFLISMDPIFSSMDKEMIFAQFGIPPSLIKKAQLTAADLEYVSLTLPSPDEIKYLIEMMGKPGVPRVEPEPPPLRTLITREWRW